eukprot:tig00000802_g4316.t1
MRPLAGDSGGELEFPAPPGFTIVRLASEHCEAASWMAARAFADAIHSGRGGWPMLDIERSGRIQPRDIKVIYDGWSSPVARRSVATGTSLIALDSSGVVVGCALCEDFFDLGDKVAPGVREEPADPGEHLGDFYSIELMRELDATYAASVGADLRRGHSFHIAELAVAEEAGGRGLGTALVAAAARLGRRLGFRVAMGEATNALSCSAFVRAGFQVKASTEYVRWRHGREGARPYSLAPPGMACSLVVMPLEEQPASTCS